MLEKSTEFYTLKRWVLAGQWWHIPLIPALERQRQVDLYEFEASLVYRESPRIAKAIQRNHVLTKRWGLLENYTLINLLYLD